MKKIISVLLVAALMLSLGACASNNPTETTGAFTTVPETTVPETTVQQTQPVETTEPEQPEAAFDGYEFRYEDQRDSLWEQDIVYFARLCLGEYVIKGHPYLTARLISITDMDNTVTQRYFYDAELRETFIAQVNELINNVPQLNDIQITYELMRILALLGDAHSQMGTGSYILFPLVVEQMEHNGEQGLYAVRIPREHSQVLYGELIAINDISIEDVMAKLRPFIPTENDYWANQCMISIFNSMMIVDLTALQAAGVVDFEETSADFTFLTDSGETVDITLEAADLVTGDYWKYNYLDHNPVVQGLLSYTNYNTTSYFHQYLKEESTMYIRLFDCSADAEYRLETFIDDVDQDLRVIGAVEKIIVDIRDNPGGYIHFVDKMLKFLDEADTKHIYILTDNGSFSAGTIFPHRAKAKLDNVTIVGEPTGQAPNFFAGATQLKLRKHDAWFALSMSYFEGDKNFDQEALIPDLLVYQNLDDYKKGIDTVLQTVLDLP